MCSDAYGFVVDYLAEILRSLRNHELDSGRSRILEGAKCLQMSQISMKRPTIQGRRYRYRYWYRYRGVDHWAA
ncbi:hypothetical protein [Thiorhodococcus mannitoliphagus]|uniref:hypothetical protein n=1 Tax=Thiorhodococcus mannitoliphagus TaxID=329406 RepID=UPI00197D00F6